MIRSPRPGPSLRVAGLVALAVFAVAPFFGTAGAASLDKDLHELTTRLREFRSKVKGGELTPEGVRQEAGRIIELKRDFVMSSEQKSGVFLEPYLDLARIDDGLEKTKKDAGRTRTARRHLSGVVTDTQGLIATLRNRPDAAAYATALTCLEGLEASEEELAADMRPDPRSGKPNITRRGIKSRTQRLIDRKLDCIASWPLVFGRNFRAIYRLLKDIDDQLERISDRHDDPQAEVVDSLDQAIRRADELRRDVAAWEDAGEPSPTSTSSPTPTRSPSASPSIQPSVSPSASQTPSPEESPTGINPHAPNVSAVNALFDTTAHVTNYSITASDPDGDPLTISWTKSGERDCGSFGGSGTTASWDHAEPPCPAENPHPGTISVFVSDGTYTCSAFYDGGSATGSGPPADCALAPRP
jgi:hypothetical protein